MKYWGATNPQRAVAYNLSLAINLYKEHVSHHPPKKVPASNRVTVEPFVCTNYTDYDKAAEALREQERINRVIRDKKLKEIDNWDLSDSSAKDDESCRMVSGLSHYFDTTLHIYIIYYDISISMYIIFIITYF